VGEAGEKEKESARCTSPADIVPRVLSFFFFDYFILMGIPSGSLCGGERESPWFPGWK